jgi:uroporphyrin-III C-methyltransferase
MTTQENIIANLEADKGDKAETPEKPVKIKKPAGYGFILFLILLLSVAVAGGAYYFWQMQQKHIQLSQKQQSDIQLLKNDINRITANVSENARSVVTNATQASNLKKQILQTETISQRAIEIVNRNQRDWALAEVDYLLRIAHQRIAVAKDIGGAIAALKGADDRLKLLGDLKLFHIRKQLAKDIGSLNAIHQADVNGISLALDQLIAHLPQLPFKSVKDEIKVQFTDNNVVEQPEVNEKTFVDSVMETVKQIGEIKVHQRSIKAASGADQQNSIEQLLRTYLLGARLAALRFDQTQFLHEITQASEIVRLHYDANDNRIKQLEKTLLSYSALQLSPNLPELTKAWSMLQKQIKNPTKQTVKSAVSNNSHKQAAPVNKGAKL